MNLSDAVAMFPTVTACEWKGRGPNSKQQGLSEKVKLWPTPRTQSKSGTGPSRTGHRADMLFPTVTTREYKGGRNPDTLAKSGRTITNSLCDYINAKMYTAVCAGDSVGTNGGGNGASLRTDIGGQLNPDWVDWLMGFPVGWTNIDLDIPLPDYDPQYFDTEPNIPRTATGIKNRVDRIICNGNAVDRTRHIRFLKLSQRLKKHNTRNGL